MTCENNRNHNCCENNCNCDTECNCEAQCDCKTNCEHDCECGCKCDYDQNSEIGVIKQELDDCKNKFLRLAAEYDNFRKRTEKEKAMIYLDASSMTILSFLPVFDTLERAMELTKNADEALKSGIVMISNQLDDILVKLEVKAFGKVGDEFDPCIHNSISHIENNEDDRQNVISQVFQKGYMLKDRVIRHAMVQVLN